jgi:hypothetical protein
MLCWTNYNYVDNAHGEVPTNNPKILSAKDKRQRFKSQRAEEEDSNYTAKLKQRVRLCEMRTRQASAALSKGLHTVTYRNIIS